MYSASALFVRPRSRSRTARVRPRRSGHRDRPTDRQDRRATADRDRRAWLRRQPHLRQHPHGRLRPLDRRGADDPRPLRDPGPLRDVGAADPQRGESRRGRDRIAWRPDGGDLLSTRAGDRAQHRRLAAVVLLVALFGRRRLARPAVRLFGLAIVYLPLVLLLGAALEPGETAERLLVLMLRAVPGWPDAAAPAGLPGPRRGFGDHRPRLCGRRDRRLAADVRSRCSGRIRGSAFASTGSATSSRRCWRCSLWPGPGRVWRPSGRKPHPRPAAIAFVTAGLFAAFVFAAGRFGADVGAAIVFPVGAVVAAMAVAGRGRRPLLLAVVAAPVAVLALLALVDLLSGANAHLTRSVLDAGGLGRSGRRRPAPASALCP